MRVLIVNWRDPWHREAGGAERYAWEMARALAARGAAVRFLTARGPGQTRGERRDGIEIVRRGGRFTVYPFVLGWLLARRRSADVVLDCQNGIPFFTPLVLPRRVPVLCVVHHVHTAQFTVHFPAWTALCEKAATLPLRTAILVVDSASTDSTADVVRQWPAGPVPVGLLRCDRPGKGIAVRTGLLATQAPFVGFCDADMATDLSALDVAVSFLAAGHPLVIGSRGLRGSVVETRSSALRGVGATLFRTMASWILPGTADTQCGFKFFAGPLARTAVRSLRTAGFAFDVELLAACLQLGATVTEIPVYWRDMAGSTFSVRRHSAAVFRDLASIWLRSRILDGRSADGPADIPGFATGSRAIARNGGREDLHPLAAGVANT